MIRRLSGTVSVTFVLAACGGGGGGNGSVTTAPAVVAAVSIADSFTRVDSSQYPLGGSVIQLQIPFETVGLTLDAAALKAGLGHWEVTSTFDQSDGNSRFDPWKDGDGKPPSAVRVDNAQLPTKGVMSLTGTYRVSEADNRSNKSSLNLVVRLIAYQTNASTGIVSPVASEYRKFTISLARSPVGFAGLTGYPMYNDAFDLSGAQTYCSGLGYRVPSRDEALAFFPNGPYGTSSGSGIGNIWTTTSSPAIVPQDPKPRVYIVGYSGSVNERYTTLEAGESPPSSPYTLCVK